MLPRSREEEADDLVSKLSDAQLAPARQTFDAHATRGVLGVADVKAALVDFGIFFSTAQTTRAIRIVVAPDTASRRSWRRSALVEIRTKIFAPPTTRLTSQMPDDAGDLKIDTFPTFVVLLSAIEGHQQRAFSETSTAFFDQPRSKQIDGVALLCYFPAYAVFLLVMFLNVHTYSCQPGTCAV